MLEQSPHFSKIEFRPRESESPESHGSPRSSVDADQKRIQELESGILEKAETKSLGLVDLIEVYNHYSNQPEQFSSLLSRLAEQKNVISDQVLGEVGRCNYWR